MSSTESGCGVMLPAETTSPDFERIISKLGSLVDRLRSVRETSVFISDALIGVQNTGEGFDDSAKPTSPEYFVIKCFDLLHDLDEEIERIEVVNKTLLSSIKSQ